MNGSFSEIDNCVNAIRRRGSELLHPGIVHAASHRPATGQMTIYANVYGGQLTVDLTGTGAPAGVVTLTPATVNFGQVEVGSTSSPLSVTVATAALSDFRQQRFRHRRRSSSQQLLRHNQPGAKLRSPVGGEFEPTAAGPVSGLLTFIDRAGTQSVVLTGTGAAAPTDVLNSASLSSHRLPEGQLSLRCLSPSRIRATCR